MSERQISHYRILDRLGAGGMGEVFLAQDLELDREVAIKLLPIEWARDPERLDRFRREARALAALNHPSVVTIHEVGHDDGHPFLVMERVDGEPLGDRIPPSGIPLASFYPLAVSLADGLAAAHERGIVHRDLKPSNVMVTRDGRVKILDFGLAKLRPAPEASADTELETEAMTIQGRVLGTLPYMSPEQAQGRAVDHRSDLFSLGAVLYEMLSGRRPFHGDTHAALVSSILRDTPPPLDEVRPDIPHHLARIVRHCLEKDPERRTQSAKDVRNELTSLEREEALDLGTEGEHPEREERPGPRRGWLPWSLAAIALLTTLALAAAHFLDRDDPMPAPATPIRSLAVLPFDNLMNDPDQEYFVEGMHDALITDLARLSDLKVISRTSVMRYRERESSVPEIAEQLGVDAVVEGAVLRVGERVRISAQLVGADDRHLWAESYDRDLVDVLELLSDVARAVADEIELTLTPAELDRLEDAPRVDSELQDLLMRGDFFVNRLSRDGALKAEELYRRAIEIAPDSADAYGRLSGVLFLQGFLWPDENASETIAEAERLARQALAIDPDVAAAHSGLGWIHLRFEWNLEAAERAFTRAVAVDPHEGFGRHGLADCAMIRGNMDESLRHLEIARELDPHSPITVMPVVAHLVFAHRFDEAIESGRRALELFPDFDIVHFWLFEAYWQQEEYEAALAELRSAAGANAGWVDDIEHAYRESGHREAMRVAARNLIASQDDPSPYVVAAYFARAGDHPSALDWLEKAADERSANLPHLYADPSFDELRSEPRYEALLRRIGMGVPTIGEE